VDILTIGQYLQPSKKHLPIVRYFTLEEFRDLREYGHEIGFRWVESAPLVRSSYHAAEQVRALSIVHKKLYGETGVRQPGEEQSATLSFQRGET
jgi:lipoic acid synthetase